MGRQSELIMAFELKTRATEQGTLILEGTATVGTSAVVPNGDVLWTLTKLDGTVINSRQDVSVTPSGSLITIALSDNDLQMFSDDPVQSVKLGTTVVRLKVGKRVLLVEFTYNSSVGNNLPVKDQVFFQVEEVIAN